jgi:predicted metal-dependent RNase
LPQEEREGSPQLDTTRVEQLAKWWRKRMGQLLDELSPALAEEQAKKELRETLANEVLDTALDTEVGRVVKAANKPKAKRVTS